MITSTSRYESQRLFPENRLPMCLPVCKKDGHGQMALLPSRNQTREARFCGVWYVCTHHDCHNSVLYVSKECSEFFDAQLKKSEQEQLSLF